MHCSAKEEAKRLEKEIKLASKAAKAAATPAGDKKAKEKVAESEEVPFVNTTPRGENRGAFTLSICYIVLI